MSPITFDAIKKIPPSQIMWEAFVPQPKPAVTPANQKPLPPTPATIGQHGQAFIDIINADGSQSSYSPPMTQEKFVALAKLMGKMDEDLTKSLFWKNYWSQPLIEHGVDPVLIKQHQQRILIGYRQRVLQTLQNAADNSFSGWKKKYKDIPASDHYLQIQSYAERFGQEKGFAQLREDCLKVLTEKQTELMALIEEKSKQHTILTEFPIIKSKADALKFSFAYDELGASQADPLLAPLLQKIKEIDVVEHSLNAAIDAVCAISLPGVNIQPHVKSAMDQFVKESHLNKLPEIGFLACLTYINQPTIVHKIHNEVMSTRAKACLEYLEDTALLRQEIRKVTVYRVRRNLIERLYEKVMHDNQAILNEQKAITPAIEICLMTLQEEYLHTIYRQIESMPPDAIDAFINQFTNDPVLYPLPPTRPHGERNDFARRELLQVRSNSEASTTPVSQEEVPLHNIDCPIEMDILGEISHQLMKLAEKELNAMEEANTVLENLAKTYEWIQAPNFTTTPQEVIALKQGAYERVKEIIENQADPAQRLNGLEQCYTLIQQEGILPSTWLKRLMSSKINRLYNLNEWIKKSYFLSLKALLDTVAIKVQRDKFIAYEQLIEPRLASGLAEDLAAHPQQAQGLIYVLQTFYARRG